MYVKNLTDSDISLDSLKKIAQDGRFRVAIFGSARITEESPLYQEVCQLAHDIAISDYDLITGGGPGVMRAASQGHSEACESCSEQGPLSIGINIRLPKEQKPNPFLDVTSQKDTFSERLDVFVLLSNIFVVATWWIGTMLELFYVWQLMQVDHICRTPIILWWNQYFELRGFIDQYIIKPWYADKKDLDLIIPVETREDVKTLIDMAYQHFLLSGRDACINITHYQAAAKRLGFIQ